MIDGLDDLVKWLQQAGYLSAADAQQVLDQWAGHKEGAQLLNEALGARRLIRKVVQKLVAGETLTPDLVDQLNDRLKRPRGYVQLEHVNGGYRLCPKLALDDPASLIMPLVESVCRLLTERDLARVKRCRNPDCMRYFFDTSKNRARRWCRMEICGNRMKAAAHYQRQRLKKERLTGNNRRMLINKRKSP